MKGRGLPFIITTIGLALAALFAVSAGAKDKPQMNAILDGLKLPPLHFQQPPVETIKLDGGATLITAPDKSLPFLTIDFVFPVGSSGEKRERAGTLASMTDLMQLGGAAGKSGEDITESLARIGASLRISHDYENWTVTLTVLKRDFNTAFSILSDVLLKPNLPADRLEVIKDRLRTDIKQRNDDPARVARRRFMEVMYPGLRRGYTLKLEDVNAITTDRVREDYNVRLHAGGLMIAVSGDYEGLEIKERLTTLTKAFPGSAHARLTAEPIEPAAMFKKRDALGQQILLVRYPATQAVIVLGTYLPEHKHPDFYGLQVGNYVLGGGSFNSRLMREVRTKRGLAYYAYSQNDFSATSGHFVSMSGTRVDQAKATLELMLQTIGGIRSPVETDELSLAKEAILNGMVFQYEDPAAFLRNEIRFRLHGLPDNYLTIFPGKVQSVTATDIAATGGRYLNPSQLAVVVVGPESLKSELSALRPVKVVDPEGPLE
ncbi:MAG: insulinase family protein [Spirochaetia bacterium]|nr:insulinase family protein [Spirochaetia bacterium]